MWTLNETHRRQPPEIRTVLAAATAAMLIAATLTLPAAADDRSLVKASEGEPYVMILLDVTGSMNRVPDREEFPPLRQDDPTSRMFQAKEALYEVMDSPATQGLHFGFATFPNRDYLRARSRLCNPFTAADNGLCISGNEARDVCGQAGNPGICGIDIASTCRGWEPNYDANDAYNGKNFNQPTQTNPNDPGYPAVMHYGDVIPMDWQSANDRAVGEPSDNRQRIRERLAPNIKDSPDADPDFDVSSYFRIASSDDSLDFVDPNQRPIIAHGFTPLANTLDNFRAHFTDWKAQARQPQHDPRFGCKEVHVILITDGLQSGDCEETPANPINGDPANAAAAVYNGGDGPQVWVIGYSTGIGSEGRENLNNIADAGGTFSCPIVNNCEVYDPETGEGDPDCCASSDADHAFFPITKEDLVATISALGNEIRTGSRSFAAAAVPQGQANVADKTFLASFVPVPNLALWPGSLDAYLRPLPTTEITVTLPDDTTEQREVPNRAANCPTDAVRECRLWDAGDRLMEQAADVDDLDVLDYNLGQGEAERRVFYSAEGPNLPDTVPAVRKPFVPTPLLEADAGELMDLMDLSCAPGCDGGDADNLTELHEVVRWFHEPKSYVVPTPDPDPGDAVEPGDEKEFLLGEIFHSDPVVVGGPENFRYFASDLFSGGRATRELFIEGSMEAACGEGDEVTNPGYVCYFARHRLRRKVILVGSNDGQLHAFDGGVFDVDDDYNPNDEDTNPDVVPGRFTNGSGRELFSYVPRAMMPTVKQQSNGVTELYGVDGRVQVADVFIDVGAGPEWRTVVFGGMREGGAGYYALDVTQPDTITALDEGNIPEPVSGSLNDGIGYVPSCTNGGSGCGTLPYPSVLWEFYDLCEDGMRGETEPCDEDFVPGQEDLGNGVPDLGDGWSRPATGIVEVCSTNESPCPAANVQRKFVAIFGGGLVPDQASGNFLYMVDVETGKAIYKRQVEGAVPSEAAVVDTDQNGILDTIYVGTTAGFMYKVDLRGTPHLPAGNRVTSVTWDPFKVFDVNLDDGGDRPIFYPPSVIFVTEGGRFALAFGTGYRENLWAEDRGTETGRFFVVLDQIVDSSGGVEVTRPFQRGDAALPLGPASLVDIDPEGTDRESDNLLDPDLTQPGWWMNLQEGEKVIAEPFALSGVLIFLTFQPELFIAPSGDTCARIGQGRSFTVLTVNGNSVLVDEPRYAIVPDLPTGPFTEAASTQNPGDTGSSGIPDDLRPVLDELKRLFPRECKFGNYSINIKTRRSDTGIHFIAPVPVCFVPKNWQGL